MRSLFWAIAAIIAGIAISSCSENNEDSQREAARNLYEKSVKLGRLYCDSMSHAKDSAEVVRLDAAYEAALTKLNFDFPAETDLGISEGENDTLHIYSARYIHLRDSILLVFGNKIHLAGDTIETESETVRAGN